MSEDSCVRKWGKVFRNSIIKWKIKWVFFGLIGVGLLVGAVIIPRNTSFFTKKEIDLWTVLALAVALAAYTSSILVELRKAIKGTINGATRNKHQEDYNWLVPVDFLLILISVVLIGTIIYQDVYQGESTFPLKLIEGSFLTLVLYFAFLHLRQWALHHQGQDVPTQSQSEKLAECLAELGSDVNSIKDSLQKLVEQMEACDKMTRNSGVHKPVESGKG